jgi:hypothetical protein
MAKYVLSYTGGSMAETEAEQQQVMAAWGAWFGQLGAAVVDPGTPFARSTAIAADGSVTEPGAAGLTGYSIISADSLEQAAGLAKSCPVLATGGAIDVYETVDIPMP